MPPLMVPSGIGNPPRPSLPWISRVFWELSMATGELRIEIAVEAAGLKIGLSA